MSLINNPIAELLHPLSRLEAAVAELSTEISAVHALPRIEDELRQTREATLAVLDELRGVRDDIGELTKLLAPVVERSGGRGG